jgi:hypothetical protein
VKISIKDFSVTMNLGNNGITLDVYDNDDKHLRSALLLGRATIEWCKGRT